MRPVRTSGLVAVALASLACDPAASGSVGSVATVGSVTSSAAGTSGESGATGASGPSGPDAGTPLRHGSPLEPIPTACSAPRIIVSTVAGNTENHYAWAATRQAILANPRFKVVSHPPEVAGEVYFRQIEERLRAADAGEARRSLIAYCKDADTCNRFAAMHETVVRSSHPRPMCGVVPGESDTYQMVDFQWNGPQGDLPRGTDTPGQCARVGACLITADPGIPGDPISECLETPSKWKAHCALQRSCADVVACLRP